MPTQDTRNLLFGVAPIHESCSTGLDIDRRLQLDREVVKRIDLGMIGHLGPAASSFDACGCELSGALSFRGDWPVILSNHDAKWR